MQRISAGEIWYNTVTVGIRKSALSMELSAQYAFLYCIIDAALILFSVVIYTAITQDFGSEEETFRFKQLVGANIIYLLSDFVLGLVYGHFIYLGFYANMLTVYTNIVALALVAFLWYRYALLRISSRLDESRLQQAISSIPVIVIILMVSGSVFNEWAFTLVEGGGFDAGDLFFIVMAFGALYLVVISALAASKYFVTTERSRRAAYLWMVLFIIPPIAALPVEVLVPKTPVVGLGMYASIHLVFFFYQSNRIYNDSLTQLNNRRRVDEYVEQRLGNIEMVYYLFDVNRFKEINDRFGHSEGDSALCYVAEAVRQACANRHQAIAGRYGGDEFVVVQLIDEDGSEVKPDELVEDVRTRLSNLVEERNLLYNLTLSVGYTYVEKSENDAANVFRRADAMMYEDKRSWHTRLSGVLRAS